MNTKRREFFATVGAMYVTSLLWSGNVLAWIAPGPDRLPGRDEYAARINKWFYLYNADATHQANLELISVTDNAADKRVEQFALTLRSDRQALAIPSGYYEVAGEPFSLFVKYTHEFAGRHYYRAEFALLK